MGHLGVGGGEGRGVRVTEVRLLNLSIECDDSRLRFKKRITTKPSVTETSPIVLKPQHAGINCKVSHSCFPLTQEVVDADPRTR